MRKLFLLAGIFLVARTAGADGVTDFVINPGAGYTISAPGSYRLSADVVMNGNDAAITITASNVSVDLGGHSLTGGPGNGVSGVAADSAIGVTIFNGRITLFGAWGVETGLRSVIRDVKVDGNNRNGGAGGITVGGSSLVERCIVSANNPIGTGAVLAAIRVQGRGGRVCDCIVSDHVTTSGNIIGINSGSGLMVLNSVVHDNIATAGSFSGIEVGSASTIRGNQVIDNTSNSGATCFGIKANTGSLIEGNVCASNFIDVSGAGQARGISAEESTIRNNECSNNLGAGGTNGSGVGIYAGSRSTIVGNRCEGNNGQGTGFAVGIYIVNSCNVEGNHVIFNGNSTPGWGIRAVAGGNIISNNKILNNGTASMRFDNSTANRVFSNQVGEDVTFDPAGMIPASVGSGDLANVIF